MKAGEEQWLPVVGYEGLYEVSDLGRVYSVPRVDSRGRNWGGHMLRQPLDGKGYPLVTLHGRGQPKAASVHHIVADAFLGPCPPGLERRHKDGDSTNCRLGNLEFGTHAENVQDKVRHGTDRRGERHPRARLTDEIVRQARERRAAGETVAALSAEYGITPSAMSKAIRGDTWRHDRQLALERIEEIATG
jgi:NUMOD4 motif/HNH endonuclease